MLNFSKVYKMYLQWELFVYFIDVTATHTRFARFSCQANILISHRKSITPGRSQSPLVSNSYSHTIVSSSACLANIVVITTTKSIFDTQSTNSKTHLLHYTKFLRNEVTSSASWIFTWNYCVRYYCNRPSLLKFSF